MTWRYSPLRFSDGTCTVCEHYSDADGNYTPSSGNTAAVIFMGDDFPELQRAVARAAEALGDPNLIIVESSPEDDNTTAYLEIAEEREYQDTLWGHAADDTKNDPFAWVSYLNQQATRWMAGKFPPFDAEVVDNFREAMVKAAAVAVAAIESLDRQRAADGHAFYEVAQ